MRTLLGVYMYVDATGNRVGAKSYLVSASFKDADLDSPKCLQFLYNAFGHDFGELHILDENANKIWSHEKGTSTQ